MLRKVQKPSAADACSGASAECSYQQAQAQMQVEAQQFAAAQACAGNTDQRICADMLTRTAAYAQAQQHAMAQDCASQADSGPCYRGLATTVAMDAQLLIPGTPLPCPGYDPSLPAPDSCPPGTPRPSPPLCEGIAAPDPSCTGN
jgi:hypothetical protein